MGYKWSDEEIEILREKFPKTSDIEIVSFFNNRSLTSIKVKAKKLKIYRIDNIKKKNRSNAKTGNRNGMYGKTSTKKNKTYDEFYGEQKSNEVKNKISKSKIGKFGLKGEKNPRYGRIPVNKGQCASEEVKIKIRRGIKKYWKNLKGEELEKRKKQLREDWVKKRNKFPDIDTLPEKITENLLKKINVNYFKKKNIGFYNCDFIIGDTIVEVQGDYWHGNPKFYKKFDKIQNKNKTRDITKFKFLKNKGFNVIYLWENDLKNNVEYCEKILLDKLNNNKEDIINFVKSNKNE